MMRKASSLVLVVTMSCTAACSGSRTRTVLDRDLHALVGKDVHLIIKRIGYPDPQDVTMTMGEKVYVWHLDECTLRVVTDDSEHVVRSVYSGSNRECNWLADRIDRDDEEYRPRPVKQTVKEVAPVAKTP